MENSLINWTHHTYNPWLGCSKVSEGCRYCYAEDLLVRRQRRLPGWGHGTDRRRPSPKALKAPLEWNCEAARTGERRRVFVASLADVFDTHPSIDPAWRTQLWDLIYECQWLDWLLLTKRPDFVAQLSPANPPPNAWIGFSAERQDPFDLRWQHVMDLPFRVRFLSYEPALGPLILPPSTVGRLHWVIYGGETSRIRYDARPADLAWARSIRNQCHAMGIPFWFKQTGSWIDGRWYGKTAIVHRQQHELLDGQIIHELPRAD